MGVESSWSPLLRSRRPGDPRPGVDEPAVRLERCEVTAGPRSVTVDWLAMSQSLLQRRLVDVSDRLKRMRAELAVTEEQLVFLEEEAEDARLRALVAETPLADVEARDARRHADALARHRDSLAPHGRASSSASRTRSSTASRPSCRLADPRGARVR